MGHNVLLIYTPLVDIHEELRTTNAFPSPVQVARGAELIARLVADIAPQFKFVRVHFIIC
jgi:hypothetical protein